MLKIIENNCSPWAFHVQTFSLTYANIRKVNSAGHTSYYLKALYDKGFET